MRVGTNETDEDAGPLPRSRTQRAVAIGRFGARTVSRLLQHGILGASDDFHAETAADLLSTLGRMRGVAAKAGQFIAQNTVLPDVYSDALLNLADRVPPMAYSAVKTQIYRDLGRDPSELFATFERSPFAAASFGQVHRATLADGTAVAVKVQYPGIADTIRADLDSWRALVGPVGRLVGVDNAEEMFGELRERIREELDYEQERASLEEFAAAIDDERVVIPRVFPALSGHRMLTTALVDAADFRSFVDAGHDVAERTAAGKTVLRFGWNALYGHRLLHADPNVGNYLFRGGDRIAVVDFGCVRRYSPEFVRGMRRLIMASIARDPRKHDEALYSTGLMPATTPRDLRELFRDWSFRSSEPFTRREFDFSSTEYFREITRLQQAMARRATAGHHFSAPPEWMFYGRYLLGITWMLHKLGARGRFQEDLLPFLQA